MLTSIISYVVTSLLGSLAGWLLHYFQAAAKDNAEKQVDEAATQKAVDADKAAQTTAERDTAAKGIADNV